jgi:hypothetical protein
LTLLLVLHAASAVVLIGAATHNGVLAYRAWRGRAVRARLQRLYASVLFATYLPTVALGLWLYPTFRLEVRATHFDLHLPSATAAFEVKEHWVALGLFVLLAYLPLSRRLDLRLPTPEVRAFHVLGLVLLVIVWWAMWTGLTLTALHPVGS